MSLRVLSYVSFRNLLAMVSHVSVSEAVCPYLSGSSHLRVWVWWVGLGVSWLCRGRGLSMMEIPTPSIRKTSTCPILPLIAPT